MVSLKSLPSAFSMEITVSMPPNVNNPVKSFHPSAAVPLARLMVTAAGELL
jgi:hypothetical protein